MSNMFTNPRDEQYVYNMTRDMGDAMSEQQVKDAAHAWHKAFKAAPAPIDTAGYNLTVNSNGSLTISKSTDHITMDFTDFQTVAQAAMKLYAQFSDHEQVISIRAKP